MVDSKGFRAARSPLIVSLLALALAACQGTDEQEEAVAEARPEEAVTESGEPLPFADPSVEALLEQIIHETNRIGGRRTVKFDLRNSSARPLSFAYTVEWLDRNGEPVYDPDSRWIPLSLAANASALLEIVAPTPRAESWRLRAAAREGE